MTGQDIARRVKNLNLPAGSFVVFGSCPMAAVGIREANDIDMLVTPEIYKKLKYKGWKVVDKGPKDTPVTHGDIEVHSNWGFSHYNPKLEHLLETAFFVDGVPFASLEEVKKWKQASDLPKHTADITLIDEYLAALGS